MPATISIIASHDDNLGIGKNNQLSWNLSTDLKRFKKLTMDHPIIMGRKTFDSLGRVLPGRDHIVITRSQKHSDPDRNVYYVNSLKEAINLAKSKDSQEIFIIGGGEIYKQALPMTNKLYLTHVYGDFNCDTFFPDYPDFNLIKKTTHAEKKLKFAYLILTK